MPKKAARSSTSKSANKPVQLPIALMAACIIILFAAGTFLFDISRNRELRKLMATPSPVVSPEPSPASTVGWNTYTSKEHNFWIMYPKKVDSIQGNWITKTTINEPDTFAIGVGSTSTIPGGFTWGVEVHRNTNVEDLIARMGNQFPDREIARQNIMIGDTPALLVTVQTKQHDWTYKMVFITHEDTVYAIGGDEKLAAEFTAFYQSFHLNK